MSNTIAPAHIKIGHTISKELGGRVLAGHRRNWMQHRPSSLDRKEVTGNLDVEMKWRRIVSPQLHSIHPSKPRTHRYSSRSSGLRRCVSTITHSHGNTRIATRPVSGVPFQSRMS